jgi:hypothetical protein
MEGPVSRARRRLRSQGRKGTRNHCSKAWMLVDLPERSGTTKSGAMGHSQRCHLSLP